MDEIRLDLTSDGGLKEFDRLGTLISMDQLPLRGRRGHFVSPSSRDCVLRCCISKINRPGGGESMAVTVEKT